MPGVSRNQSEYYVVAKTKVNLLGYHSERLVH